MHMHLKQVRSNRMALQSGYIPARSVGNKSLREALELQTENRNKKRKKSVDQPNSKVNSQLFTPLAKQLSKQIIATESIHTVDTNNTVQTTNGVYTSRGLNNLKLCHELQNMAVRPELAAKTTATISARSFLSEVKQNKDNTTRADDCKLTKCLDDDQLILSSNSNTEIKPISKNKLNALKKIKANGPLLPNNPNSIKNANTIPIKNANTSNSSNSSSKQNKTMDYADDQYESIINAKSKYVYTVYMYITHSYTISIPLYILWDIHMYRWQISQLVPFMCFSHMVHRPKITII